MTKIKINYTIDVFLLRFFLIFFSKSTSVSCPFDFILWKKTGMSALCLVKNVQNQKYIIISTYFFAKFCNTFRWLKAPNSHRTETRKNKPKIYGHPLLATERLHFFFIFSPKTHRSDAHLIFIFEKWAWVWCVFDEKCPNSKTYYTIDVFFCTFYSFLSFLTKNVKNQK